MNAIARKRISVYDLVMVALFAALIAVCAWVTVPGAVPFTLQTMGVFLAVGLLGGKRGTASVLVYILLGAVGMPVFSGFSGGVGRPLVCPCCGLLFGHFCDSFIVISMRRTTSAVAVVERSPP